MIHDDPAQVASPPAWLRRWIAVSILKERPFPRGRWVTDNPVMHQCEGKAIHHVPELFRVCVFREWEGLKYSNANQSK